eukprot:scaffold37825_cov154-Skeletonema_marinoi.AAC.4
MGFGTVRSSSLGSARRDAATSVSCSILLDRSLLEAAFLGNRLPAAVPEAFLLPVAVVVVFRAPSTPARATAASSMVEVLEVSASAAAAFRVRLGGMTIVVTMQCNCILLPIQNSAGI